MHQIKPDTIQVHTKEYRTDVAFVIQLLLVPEVHVLEQYKNLIIGKIKTVSPDCRKIFFFTLISFCHIFYIVDRRTEDTKKESASTSRSHCTVLY